MCSLKLTKHSRKQEIQGIRAQEAIKNKAADDLHNEEFCFHPQTCCDEFQRIQANQIQSKQCNKST